MHRLVQLFILNDVGRGTTMWNDVHSLALLAVHQEVGTELRKKGNSFFELPDVFEDNHVQLAAHTLALVRHYVHSEGVSENWNDSKVYDIHKYTRRVMGFMGKSEEGVEVWEDLLVILNNQQAGNGKKGITERLQDVWYRRNRGKAVKLRIAHTHCSLGTALMATGKLNRAASQLELSFKMKRAIHGPKKPHPDIASSLNNLGNVYHCMGELKKALEKHEQRVEMERAIHGPNKPHPDIAMSLNNLGLVYYDVGELEKALEKHEQSVEMFRAIYGSDEPHAHTAMHFGGLVRCIRSKRN